MKKILFWVVVVFIAWWVISAPVAAGHEAHRLAVFASHAATSISTALSSL